MPGLPPYLAGGAGGQDPLGQSFAASGAAPAASHWPFLFWLVLLGVVLPGLILGGLSVGGFSFVFRHR